MLNKKISILAYQVIQKALEKNISISTAESCTGGLISSYLTSVPRASQCFYSGLITYSDQAKIKILKVNKITINNYGSVSKQVALEMAINAQKISNSNIAVSVTGYAGPNLEKNKFIPLGVVYFGVSISHSKPNYYKKKFIGSRDEIRDQSTIFALKLILNKINLFSLSVD